jgi:hypothetical protein
VLLGYVFVWLVVEAVAALRLQLVLVLKQVVAQTLFLVMHKRMVVLADGIHILLLAVLVVLAR